MTTTPLPRDSRWQRVLVLVGIVVLGFNLRPAAVSVGPVLDDVTHSLAMSSTVAGVLTTLPVLAFACFGAVAPAAAARVGAHRLTFGALLAVTVGLALRPWTSNIGLFLALSLLALAGMATANVLLPSLVRLHFPDQVGRVTSLYTTALALGLTLSSVLTVPISDQFSPRGWRFGLGAWAITALLAALPWVGLLRHDRAVAGVVEPRGWRLRDVLRTRLGWVMAILFGLQSLQAYSIFGWFAAVYRDAGFSAGTAGLLLGVITGVSIPLSFLLPPYVARLANPRWLLVAVMACYPIGYLGLVVAPHGGAWVWAVALGIGCSIFPLVLTMIGLRARTPAGTAALSGFTQSVGYLIAVVGPFGVGALHGSSGSWTVPLVVLSIVNVPQVLAVLYVARPAYIEDQLVRR